MLKFLRPIKYGIQRFRHGFSDEDCWDVGSYLMDIIPPMVRQLKKGIGCPSELYDPDKKNEEFHKWHEILEEIAQGFEAGKMLKDMRTHEMVKTELGYEMKFDEERNKQLSEKWDKGKMLFIEYYFSLWD